MIRNAPASRRTLGRICGGAAKQDPMTAIISASFSEISSDAQKTAQTYLIRANLIGSLTRDLLVGGYIVAFAVQVLDYSNEQISWFLAAVPMLVVLRYPFLDVIRKVPRIYPTRAARCIQMFCLAALFVLPTDWITLPVLMGLAAVFIFGNDFLQNSVWMNLVAEVTTRSDRGKFLGRLRTAKLTTAMLFALFGMVLVGDELSRSEHRILLLIVMALLANALFWFWRVKPEPVPDQVRDSRGRGQFWLIVRTSKLLRRPLALEFVDRVMSWPILLVYLIGALNMPANVFMLYVVAGMMGPICSVFFWGRRADATGVRKIYLSYFIVSLTLFPILLFVPDFDSVPYQGAQWYVGVIALLLFTFAGGVIGAGHGMAASMYKAHYVNDRHGFHAVNILTAGTKVFTGVLTGIGGLVLALFADVEIASYATGAGGFLWLDPFRLVMIGVVTVFALLGAWISLGIDH